MRNLYAAKAGETMVHYVSIITHQRLDELWRRKSRQESACAAGWEEACEEAP
jgi:hypothetical protein